MASAGIKNHTGDLKKKNLKSFYQYPGDHNELAVIGRATKLDEKVVTGLFS